MKKSIKLIFIVVICGAMFFIASQSSKRIDKNAIKISEKSINKKLKRVLSQLEQSSGNSQFVCVFNKVYKSIDSDGLTLGIIGLDNLKFKDSQESRECNELNLAYPYYKNDNGKEMCPDCYVRWNNGELEYKIGLIRKESRTYLILFHHDKRAKIEAISL